MNRKYNYGALVFILITALIAGCSGTGSNVQTDSPKPSATTSASGTVKLPEPASLRILTENSTAWPVKKDWPVWKWVKEKTNITMVQETQTGPESMALAIASGDMPDLFSVFPEDAQKYGPQGAFLDLSKYMDKMPNVKAFLASRPDVAQRMTAPGGEMYQLLNDGAGAGSQGVWFYRDDIFKQHDIQEPKTWDELYETAKKLKQLYPDSYPFVFRHGLGTLGGFGPSFGIYPTFFEDKATGKMKYGVTDPGFKKMIEYLTKFYKEGLTPPDWLSMDYKAWTQFMTTNKSFITFQYIGQIEIMNAQLQNGAHLKFMPPPLGYGSKAYLPKGDFETFGFAVSSKTKNLDAALRYLDFIYSKEGTDILSWGKEGETYTIEGGKRKFMTIFKGANDLRKEAGIMTAGTYGLFDYAALMSLSNENEQYSYQEAKKYQFPVIGSLPPLKAEERNAITMNEEQVTKYYNTSVAKFIMGETPLTQWDEFIGELNKLGSQKLVDVYQIGLDRIKVK
ncbi:extracellular solute-binding protein [Paenibacillus sp. HWE-109]|uniref:extracellular solute-binding protein n=1 Tax=Paenibacillus sp. HWE-109 TaxID=1306526 RepID=UPI001EDFE400|nr:extracellular solute-binding protein [Paenibacillus sp. HWE-109]UKS28541.1 extracellular solute-binding protein [Paenibacillus sp. HWE-109]